MALVKYLGLAALLALNFCQTEGHGRVMDPVNRASAWRKGFPVEKNYDDAGNYCGSFSNHYEKNDGKCGLCGDDYSLPRPRPNENGGTYGSGIIVQRYKAGSTILVNVTLTANHRGYFTFDLCSLKSKYDRETEECFAAHELPLAYGGFRYPITDDRNGDYLIPVRLPAGFTCERCVLRWQYTAGNNWGTCENGEEQMGCGNQETFRTCSDIAIQ